jgi:hypothetical protein
METCLVIRLKTVITPTDLLSKMLKGMVPRLHETVILLTVLMVQNRGLCDLKEETKSHMFEIKVFR